MREAIFPKAPAAGGEAGRRHKNQKRNAKRMIKILVSSDKNVYNGTVSKFVIRRKIT